MKIHYIFETAKIRCFPVWDLLALDVTAKEILEAESSGMIRLEMVDGRVCAVESHNRIYN